MTALTLSLSLGIGLFIGLMISSRFVFKKIAHSESIVTLSVIIPCFLTLLRIVLLSFQQLVAKPITNWSRYRVMINGQVLIDKIEGYRSKYGKYPQTLNAVWKDYKTGIRGIEKYQYALRRFYLQFIF
jgi:hypothetical protein